MLSCHEEAKRVQNTSAKCSREMRTNENGITYISPNSAIKYRRESFFLYQNQIGLLNIHYFCLIFVLHFVIFIVPWGLLDVLLLPFSGNSLFNLKVLLIRLGICFFLSTG